MNQSGRIAVLLCCIFLPPYFASSATPILKAKSAVSSQAPSEEISMSIHGPRVLSNAAETIGRQFGIPVSFEEAAWVYSGDLEVRLNSVGAIRPSSTIPRIGNLAFAFQINSETKRPLDTAEYVLLHLLTEYSRQMNPGEFRLVRLRDGFSIVPNRISDASGRFVNHSSPLDLKISFPEEERGIDETLATIAKEIEAQSGKKIVVETSGSNFGAGIGQVLPSRLPRFIVRLGANGEVARDVLERALREVRYSEPLAGVSVTKTCWSLNYDPDSQVYLLNLKQVLKLNEAVFLEYR